MTELVRYDAAHRRVYFFGRRLHHGLTGAALATIGLVLMWDDRHDAPWYPTRQGGLAGPRGLAVAARIERHTPPRPGTVAGA